MIKVEAEKLIGAFFLAFPQFRKWLNDTEDPNATLDVWCRTLESVDRDEAAAIVEEMATGRFPVPANLWQKGLLSRPPRLKKPHLPWKRCLP